MHSMDQTILSTFPVVVAPMFGDLPPSPVAGTRYIASQNGMWREITLPWVRCIHQIAASQVVLPYGIQRELIEFYCGPIPKALRFKFMKDAQGASPTEIAAAYIWNQETGYWRYELRETINSGSAFVHFKEVRMEEGEFLVLDVHSHGHFDAHFSIEDDKDDAGSMKFSGVLGELHTDTPSAVFRLNLLGKTWPATLTAEGKLELIA